MIASALAVTVLKSISHPSIPGYILAGIALNNLIIHEELLGFVELGAIFLVFVIGLQLEPDRIGSVADDSLRTAFVSTLLVGFLAYTASMMIGFSTVEGVYFGIAAGLSSSLVGLRMIEDDLKIDLLHGRLAESINLVQDLFAVLVISAISAATSANTLTVLGSAILLLGFSGIFRSKILEPLFEKMERTRELTMLASISSLVIFTALAELSGLSVIVGSFAAGFSMAKFPYNEEVLEAVEPLKDFFSAVFFVALGSMLSMPATVTLLSAALLFFFSSVLKPLITGFYLIERGLDERTSYLTGFSIDQISEFGLIFAIQGFLTGAISEPIFQSIVIATVASMSFSSYTSRHQEKIAAYLKKIEMNGKRVESDAGDVKDHVLILGYHVQGRKLAESLAKNREIVIIDNNPEKITEAKEEGYSTVLGDAIDLKTWEAAKIEEAEILISTVPSYSLSKRLLEIETDAKLFLRADKPENAIELMEEGANFAELPKISAAERVKHHVTRALKDPHYVEELRRQNLLDLRREQHEKMN